MCISLVWLSHTDQKLWVKKNWEMNYSIINVALVDKNLSKREALGKSNKRNPWWWKGWKSLVSVSGCQRLAADSKPMTTESWDYWHLTPLMWFLLKKQTCSLPSFLKCYTLTGIQSAIHGWTGFFLDRGLLYFCTYSERTFQRKHRLAWSLQSYAIAGQEQSSL